MFGPHWGKRERETEKRLRDDRPRPSDELMRSILGEIGTPQQEKRPRSTLRPAVRSLALTALGLVGLLAIGGLGFGASSVTNTVSHFANHLFISKTEKQVHVVSASAAQAQYGTTTTTATTTSGGGPAGGAPTTTTVSAATTTNAATGSVTAPVQAASTGSVSVAKPGSTAPAASITWSASTFTTPVTVAADPAPVLGKTIIGSSTGETGPSVSIVVKDSSGNVIHNLPAPLEVTLPNAPAGFVPMISEDGVNFRALKQISGPPLPAGMQDAYYVDSSGGVHILTLHLTIFAVLFKGNATESESGRKLAAPGSGKFGDPVLIHAGPPNVKITKTASANGKKVSFRFFVDEQVAAYMSVISGGKKVAVLTGKSAFRGDKIGGKNRKTIHIPILRLGTMGTTLDVPGLKPGAMVRLTMIDFDGNKVTKTLKISG